MLRLAGLMDDCWIGFKYSRRGVSRKQQRLSRAKRGPPVKRKYCQERKSVLLRGWMAMG